MVETEVSLGHCIPTDTADTNQAAPIDPQVVYFLQCAHSPGDLNSLAKAESVFWATLFQKRMHSNTSPLKENLDLFVKYKNFLYVASERNKDFTSQQ